ncbi:hypothetical protein C0J52_21943 [Blattella germanica]|nr:hypothetical protein C0J52_21943 [Blattella germanica]
MSKTSHPGLKRWQYIFSSCSRRKITEALRTKGFCLEKTEEEFCGNGLIEHGEDCDCGLPFDCFERDPCCLPRGAHEDSCRVNRSAGYSCHPSQGFCCMPNCQLRNLEYLGLVNIVFTIHSQVYCLVSPMSVNAL